MAERSARNGCALPSTGRERETSDFCKWKAENRRILRLTSETEGPEGNLRSSYTRNIEHDENDFARGSYVNFPSVPSVLVSIETIVRLTLNLSTICPSALGANFPSGCLKSRLFGSFRLEGYLAEFRQFCPIMGDPDDAEIRDKGGGQKSEIGRPLKPQPLSFADFNSPEPEFLGGLGMRGALSGRVDAGAARGSKTNSSGIGGALVACLGTAWEGAWAGLPIAHAAIGGVN